MGTLGRFKEKCKKFKKEEVAGSFHSTLDKPVPSEYDWWSGFQSYSIAGVSKEWEGGGNMNRSGFLTSISKMCFTSTLQTASVVFCEKKKRLLKKLTFHIPFLLEIYPP